MGLELDKFVFGYVCDKCVTRFSHCSDEKQVLKKATQILTDDIHIIEENTFRRFQNVMCKINCNWLSFIPIFLRLHNDNSPFFRDGSPFF